MKSNLAIFFVFALVSIVTACSGEKKSETTEEGVSTVLPDMKNEVTVLPLNRQAFNHELISNGKVAARSMADLFFQSSEIIANIWVKNGDRVRKGQKIAELDKFRITNKLAQSKDAMDRAELDLQDVLIGQGYNLDNLSQVPEDIMKLAKVKSSYDQNKYLYELAQHEEEKATLLAPFDGVVANLFAKPYNMANTSEVFCTIIDSRGMEVDFTVLESELPLIKTGDKVVVSPFAEISSKYNGSITEINPLVDEKGMVRVKARVDSNKLFTGMNVRVSVHRSLGEQLVVPKSAVVLRSGKQVVFTYKDGKAMWNYVQTALENAEYYTIADGLKEGDTVIVSGNINLAHEAPVSVIN
ncbi:efflux RND transporter periplasmic adaptor subunit [Bacteroides sp. 519]|uniref:efflux RND transporter periplasmic adaptor subunit n=1 Tax=Bacteroides sp. 519 TaxID=2302937 RepID=UPI0013D655B9|nr:efflux RND transporter periplasmic adaptor subunit [Bacteroides sp. 519]NDV58511.1 efflux RND transporter periplasmic adaptor subunit [Bacteroides sp. 519]